MLHRAAELTQQALLLAVVLSGPALLAAAVVGVVMGLFSAATQIQDSAVGFLPKFVAVALVLVGLGAWGASTLLRFTHELWRALPTLVR
ncbi:MAG: flagellar biosynthetic protein FliQ [Deltaproteobacteria bacterium]|nr:flagellar biosynthetic protein FliQ [Deltaproteobacteria bacterium]